MVSSVWRYRLSKISRELTVVDTTMLSDFTCWKFFLLKTKKYIAWSLNKMFLKIHLETDNT